MKLLHAYNKHNIVESVLDTVCEYSHDMQHHMASKMQSTPPKVVKPLL